jgi:hypothetical protein
VFSQVFSHSMRFRIKDSFKTYSVSGSLSFCESRVLRNAEYYAAIKTIGNFLMHIAIFLFSHLFYSFPDDNLMVFFNSVFVFTESISYRYLKPIELYRLESAQTAWQWPLSCIHSVMMEISAQLGEVGVLAPPPFTLSAPSTRLAPPPPPRPQQA